MPNEPFMLADPEAKNFSSSLDLRATKSSQFRVRGVRTIRVRGLNHYYGSGDLRKQVLFDNNLDVYEIGRAHV